jgi:hypothetical protein
MGTKNVAYTIQGDDVLFDPVLLLDPAFLPGTWFMPFYW